jgi:hypothetical protein
MIIIKNKEYLKTYAEELARFGISSEEHDGICLVFKNQSDETEAFNRILTMQINERVPLYFMATQDRSSFDISKSTPEYIG